MRNFRRLPTFVRVVDVVGIALAAAATVLFIVAFAMQRELYPSTLADASRLQLIALDLGMLAGACVVVVRGYTRRFRQPGNEPLPLDSWQSHVRAVALPGALPLSALTLAIFIPPTLGIYGLAFGISIIAAWALGASLITQGQPIG
ncbi:MAG TPA: hypothetical protein VFN11_22165 [Ktedonobacterales bacterium]|nr:hypothetical protein [Ktedonobacterales bacterium]